MSKTDLHIHTLVSDGNATPLDMLAAAKELGLAAISFCDHDALGAYRHWGDLFSRAKALGIELLTGIELDTDYRGREVHLLGYNFDLDDAALNRHLAATQTLRKDRVQLQIAIINRFFGRQVIDLDKVLFPSHSSPIASSPLPRTSEPTSVRDTLMKPHLVHAMLEQGLFAEYRAAAHWLGQIAQVPVQVPKLPLAEAISLLSAAGGEAVLAHPGFLLREMGIVLPDLLNELVPLGLSGLEVDYPYAGTSSFFPDAAAERLMIEELRSAAGRFKLKMTRGSDAHSIATLKKFANSGL